MSCLIIEILIHSNTCSSKLFSCDITKPNIKDNETYIDTVFSYNKSYGFHLYDPENSDEKFFAKYPGAINEQYNTDANKFTRYTKIISTYKTFIPTIETYLD